MEISKNLNLKTLISGLLLFFSITSLYAQKADTKTKQQNDIYHNYNDLEAYKTFLDKVSQENSALAEKNIKKQYSRIIEKKNTELIKQMQENGFLFDTVAYPYLSAVFNYILEKNSLDKKQFHFFIDRSSEVNAYCYEDGTIICNLGLVSVLENESQAAMVFCHELGHFLLKHSNNAIISQLELFNSAEFNTRLKKIKNQKYNTKELLENVLMENTFDRSKHSRLQEKAADSVGMLLYMNTKYNRSEVSRIFDLLDSTENKTRFCKINDFFRQENIKIDEELLKPEKKMSFGAAKKKEVIDSLKTHPDCAKRKVFMQTFFEKYPASGQQYITGTQAKLAEVKKIAFFDEAGFSKEKDNLGFYLYQLIQNNAVFPNTNYIKTALFNALLAIHENYKAHTLYKVVSTQYIPEREGDEYIKLLRLFDRISLNELAEIIKSYYQNNKSLINASTESINALKNLN